MVWRALCGSEQGKGKVNGMVENRCRKEVRSRRGGALEMVVDGCSGSTSAKSVEEEQLVSLLVVNGKEPEELYARIARL